MRELTVEADSDRIDVSCRGCEPERISADRASCGLANSCIITVSGYDCRNVQPSHPSTVDPDFDLSSRSKYESEIGT